LNIKIKFPPLVIIALLISIHASAQDTIVKRNNEQIVAKIIEITPTAVEFKKWSSIDGPNYLIDKTELTSIIYQNGEVTKFESGSNFRHSTASSLKLKIWTDYKVNFSKKDSITGMLLYQNPGTIIIVDSTLTAKKIRRSKITFMESNENSSIAHSKIVVFNGNYFYNRNELHKSSDLCRKLEHHPDSEISGIVKSLSSTRRNMKIGYGTAIGLGGLFVGSFVIGGLYSVSQWGYATEADLRVSHKYYTLGKVAAVAAIPALLLGVKFSVEYEDGVIRMVKRYNQKY
jgi:hypothetical protein